MLTLLALAANPAHAIIYAGNPELRIDVDRAQHDFVSADVTLAKVRMHYCGGGYADYNVGQSIDPVAGWSMRIQGGDYCQVTFVWGSDLYIDGDGAAGPFTLLYGSDTTAVPLQSPIPPVDLVPFQVVSGIIYAGNPELWVLIQ